MDGVVVDDARLIPGAHVVARDGSRCLLRHHPKAEEPDIEQGWSTLVVVFT